MSIAQFVRVFDVSDAESDSGDKTRVWSNVTVPTASGSAFLPTFGSYVGGCLGSDVAWAEGYVWT
jgi:hypothetical protein